MTSQAFHILPDNPHGQAQLADSVATILKH